MAEQAILWRRLDQPGHEFSCLSWQHPTWRLAGCALFAYHQQPYRLDYLVVCNSQWQTVSGRVSGWMGNETVEVELSVDAAGRWRLNGTECPQVAGCLDLDLSFSPSTNLLPLHRLGLGVGQAAEVQAAWLRFPGFTLEPLRQRYRRLAVATYAYESADGEFSTELQVNEAGFVTRYPPFWQVEAVS